MISWARRLRERGILGINQRNGDFIFPYNPRRYYPMVDDKSRTKLMAIENGIAVPELYATVEIEHDVRALLDTVARYDSFVVKPAKGSGGNGVLVIDHRLGQQYCKSSGALLSGLQMQRHTSNILSGMYSLGGAPDKAIVEYRVRSDSFFENISYQGVPDIRVIVFRGVPVASMLRLPTRASDGKANLHQGAVGVGLRLRDGLSLGGVVMNKLTDIHPDTHRPVTDLHIPHWRTILMLAARCSTLVPLEYIGVDIVVDREYGPMVLEFNARPGLSVQLATGRGLLGNIKRVEAIATLPASADERVAIAENELI